MRQSRTVLKELTAAYRAVLRYGILCNLIAFGSIIIPAYAETEQPDNTKTLVDWVHPDMTSFTTINGDHTLTLSGDYHIVTGTNMRNIINGNINISLNGIRQYTEIENTNDETGVYGSLFVASNLSVPYVPQVTSEHALLQQKINGNTTISITNSEIQSKVAGHNFLQSTDVNYQELINSGATGKTTVTLNNTSVGRGLYGVDFGKYTINSGVSFGDIELNINNSFVKEEVVSVDSNASAGNVVINVRGQSVIGYTDAFATDKYLDAGGWIVAGANRSGATVMNTVVNLDTMGADNTIYIGGDVHAGSLPRTGVDTDLNSVIGDAALNMFGGGDINIGGNVTAHNVAGATTLNLDDVNVTIGGTVREFETINVGADSVLSVGNLVLNETDSVNVIVQDSEHYGKLNFGTLDAHNAKLNIILDSAGVYDIMTADKIYTDFDWNLSNPLFNLVRDGNTVSAQIKTTEQLAADIGADNNTSNMMIALANSDNSDAVRIKTKIQEHIMNGDSEYVKREVDKLNPSTSPVATSVALSVQNQVFSAVGERMSLALTGHSGGDVHADLGVWAKGMYNKTKHKNLLDGYTWGTSVGIDTDLNHSVILGLGYAYGQTDARLHNSVIDIDSNTIFVYGQYRNSDWFINGTIAYTMSKYDWSKNAFGVNYDTAYHVNSLSEQVMGGYHFYNGITPILGLRYLDVHKDSYFDGLTFVSNVGSAYLTGVAGVDYKYTWIAPNTSLFWNPELHAALTYDMVSDSEKALVMMPGAAAYTVASEGLSRIGSEFGIGLSAEYYYLTVSLNYDLNLHRDFTSQTGAVKVKYKF